MKLAIFAVLSVQNFKIFDNDVYNVQETTINSLTSEIDRLRLSKGVCEREFREYRSQVSFSQIKVFLFLIKEKLSSSF